MQPAKLFDDPISGVDWVDRLAAHPPLDAWAYHGNGNLFNRESGSPRLGKALMLAGGDWNADDDPATRDKKIQRHLDRTSGYRKLYEQVLDLVSFTGRDLYTEDWVEESADWEVVKENAGLNGGKCFGGGKIRVRREAYTRLPVQQKVGSGGLVGTMRLRSSTARTACTAARRQIRQDQARKGSLQRCWFLVARGSPPRRPFPLHWLHRRSRACCTSHRAV